MLDQSRCRQGSAITERAHEKFENFAFINRDGTDQVFELKSSYFKGPSRLRLWMLHFAFIKVYERDAEL